MKYTVKQAIFLSWLSNVIALAVAAVCSMTVACLTDTVKQCADHFWTRSGIRQAIDSTWYWFADVTYIVYPLIFIVGLGTCFLLYTKRSLLDTVFYAIGHVMLNCLISSTVQSVALPPDASWRFWRHIVVWAIGAGITMWAVARWDAHRRRNKISQSEKPS